MSRRKAAPASLKLIRSKSEVMDMSWLQQIKSETNLRRISSINTPASLEQQMEYIRDEAIIQNPFLRAKVKAYMNHLNGALSPRDKQILRDQTNESAMPSSTKQKATLKRVSAELHLTNIEDKITRQKDVLNPHPLEIILQILNLILHA